MSHSKSTELFSRAKRVIPGGVNSPVRAFKSVGCDPVFIERGESARVYDVDGASYIDYVCSWGPLILGHAYPDVVDAVRDAAVRGTSFGASTAREVELAEMIVDAVPSIDMVRLVNSGTEALMSAIRVARGFTGRAKIVKFDGCYHGHSDGLLAKAGSGVATLGIPDCAGVPESVTSDTIVLPYNDIDSVRGLVDSVGSEIACIVLEPVVGNMGVLPPKPGYLAGLRELCDRHAILLVFDEVITGFRVAYGGAQSLYGVAPDLTTLGKIIGGGLPVGAYGGRREIMETVAPVGPVYQAGTLSGNPIAVAAGIATLTKLRSQGVYEDLERKSARLQAGLAAAAREAGIAVTPNRVGSMMTLFFTPTEVFDAPTARSCDTALYAHFFREMLSRGVYLAPSQFEAAFVSTAHTDADIDATITAARKALASVSA